MKTLLPRERPGERETQKMEGRERKGKGAHSKSSSFERPDKEIPDAQGMREKWGHVRKEEGRALKGGHS